MASRQPQPVSNRFQGSRVAGACWPGRGRAGWRELAGQTGLTLPGRPDDQSRGYTPRSPHVNKRF